MPSGLPALFAIALLHHTRDQVITYVYELHGEEVKVKKIDHTKAPAAQSV